MDKYPVDKSLMARKRFHVMAILLLGSLFVGLLFAFLISSADARGNTFVIQPCEEAIEKVQLTATDNVVGNMTVNNGTVFFFVTDPSYDIVYQNNRTSFDNFNFTANESGTYVMHFVNKYQSTDVSVVLNYGINFFIVVTSTINFTSTTWTFTVTTQAQTYLDLVVSPMGFPVPGGSWQINVYYETSISNGTAYYSSLPNATVEVTTVVEGQTNVYSYTTDERGHLEFQFLPQYSDISFQAVSGENKSDIIAFTQRSEHYVPSDFVDSFYQWSIVMSGISAPSFFVLLLAKRIRVIFKWLMGGVFGLSIFQLVISVAAKSFWWTPWGYPDDIYSVFTWTLLRYVGVIGMVLFGILALFAFAFKIRSPEDVSPS